MDADFLARETTMALAALQTLARAIFNQPLKRSKGIFMSTDVKPKGKARKARKAPPHFTPEFQRWARSQVSSESCAKNGAKGFKATVQKHGHEPAFQGVRRWRLNKPSSNELRMIGILARLGIAYEREYRLGTSLYTLDFYLPATGQAIEVNSRIHTQLDVEKRERQAAIRL
jgi:hypothetical protein